MAERSWQSRLWYESLRRVVQLTAVAGYSLRVWGRENIPPTGGVLVVSNHQSHFDPPLIGMGCPRRMNYLARSTLFGFAPFRWLIHSLDAIPIEREGIGLGGIKESLKRLKRGEMVLIFPEGTRTRDGQVAPFLPGFTTLATRSRSAILPVAIEGAFQAWPRWRKVPGLGTIHVRFGKPILPEQVAGCDEREIVAEVEARVRVCHAQLLRHPAFSRTKRLEGPMSRDRCDQAADESSGKIASPAAWRTLQPLG
ncbi:MAG: lysophospholipid acyltransferase family protein [Planctomycetota bacterium]